MRDRLLIPLVFIAAAGAFQGCSAPEPAPIQSARLEEVEGTVRVARNGETMAAEVDMEILAGDEVSTLQDGLVTISLLDDHLVKLSENSRFVLEEIKPGSVSGALRARARLLAGRVYASLGELAGEEADFSISTPSAVAAVKGTTFGVEIQDGATTISVMEGEVDMAAVNEQGQAGERIRLKPGYESTCRARAGERIEARRMSRERRERIRKPLDAIRDQARDFRKLRRSGELHDLRRLRALARAGKLDEASGKLQKRLLRNPALREQMIKHGERHRQLQQQRRLAPAQKKQAVKRAAPAQKKQAVKRAAPAQKKQAVKRAAPAQKKPAAKPAAPAKKKTPAPAPQPKQ